jgi:hypothetical protein
MMQEPHVSELDCTQVREVLSDFLDMRSGSARPVPGQTPLTVPAFLASVEAHLGSCAACRSELEQYAHLGELFADYPIFELPPARYAEMAETARQAASKVAPASKADRVVRSSAFNILVPLFSAAAGVLLVLVLWSALSTPRALQTANLVVEKTSPASPAEANTKAPLPLVSEKEEDRPDLAGWMEGRPRLEFPRKRATLRMEAVQPAAVGETCRWDYDPSSAESKKIIEEIRELIGRHGSLTVTDRDGLLGVRMLLTPQGEKMVEGLLVADVRRGSPADLAGLLPGDYLVAINERCIGVGTAEEAVKFLGVLQEAGAGAKVELTYARRLPSPGPTADKSFWVLRRTEATLAQ